jgi:hypothetical protein
MGSPLILNDVLTRTGTPVSFSNYKIDYRYVRYACAALFGRGRYHRRERPPECGPSIRGTCLARSMNVIRPRRRNVRCPLIKHDRHKRAKAA